MRGSPSCVIAVRRFALWRGLVVALAALSLAALLAWLVLAPAAQSVAVRVAASFLALALLAVAASLLRLPAVELSWDGVRWGCRQLEAAAIAPATGELEVAIDLGSFLLIRFSAAAGGPRPKVRWIPVERRGLEREWHSFRCAVYSPRPVAGSGSVAAPPHP